MPKRRKPRKLKPVTQDMTVLETADLLRVSRALVQQWVDVLPEDAKYMDGRRWMIRAQAVNRLADQEERAKITGKSTRNRKSQSVRALEDAVKPLEQKVARLEKMLERVLELLEGERPKARESAKTRKSTKSRKSTPSGRKKT